MGHSALHLSHAYWQGTYLYPQMVNRLLFKIHGNKYNKNYRRKLIKASNAINITFHQLHIIKHKIIWVKLTYKINPGIRY